MNMLKESVADAVTHTLAGMEPGDGGIIAVGKDGSAEAQFNTFGMFRGILTSDMAAPDCAIWK